VQCEGLFGFEQGKARQDCPYRDEKDFGLLERLVHKERSKTPTGKAR
jgi:hypothetical protein